MTNLIPSDPTVPPLHYVDMNKAIVRIVTSVPCKGGYIDLVTTDNLEVRNIMAKIRTLAKNHPELGKFVRRRINPNTTRVYRICPNEIKGVI
jgi:hypothetical protein